MRIVSLLPSATDIVCSLGLADHLVGRTHECDWPPGIESVPVVTLDRLDTASMSSREIDAAIGASVHSGSSVYQLDLAALRRARPDLILTQELCEVCAVSYRAVTSAARMLEAGPAIVSLEPRSIHDILEHILLVGRLTGVREVAEELVRDARQRLDRLRRATGGRPAVPTFCIEWMDPIFAAGHWVPEQVAAAGGVDDLAQPGQPSRRIEWEDVVARNPEVLILMPCGMSINRTLSELQALTSRPGWHALKAVAQRRVWAVDGPSYFNRPGPRVIRGAEVLAGLLHPDVAKCGPQEAVRLEGPAQPQG